MELLESFSVFMREVDGGQLDADLADALRQVVQQVQSTNKKGSMVFTIDIEPNGDNRVLIKTPSVNVKFPQASRGSTVFYADENGNLSRRDPRQMTLTDLEQRSR